MKKLDSSEQVDPKLEKVYEIVIDTLHKYLLVNGEMRVNGGVIEISDYIDGKLTLFGRGKIKLDDGVLLLEMTENYFSGIPMKAELFKSRDQNGNPCKEVKEDTQEFCDDVK